ncbi:MAG TPA: hypothetical protein DCG51_01650, partial [Erysipelotrichaceae bacterium]|nr:hypothetical protein [Erysipelotrichaceae bacterium]
MFARQLTLLLDTLEVSGSDLAGYAQIDRTAISRMKNGSRQPKHDGTSVRKLIHGIISYCSQNGKTDTLLELVGIENPSAEELSQALLQWLYEDSNADEQNTASPTERISAQ